MRILQNGGHFLCPLRRHIYRQFDKKVQNAIAGAMFEIDPSVSESDIERKLTELNIEV